MIISSHAKFELHEIRTAPPPPPPEFCLSNNHTCLASSFVFISPQSSSNIKWHMRLRVTETLHCGLIKILLPRSGLWCYISSKGMPQDQRSWKTTRKCIGSFCCGSAVAQLKVHQFWVDCWWQDAAEKIALRLQILLAHEQVRWKSGQCMLLQIGFYSSCFILFIIPVQFL